MTALRNGWEMSPYVQMKGMKITWTASRTQRQTPGCWDPSDQTLQCLIEVQVGGGSGFSNLSQLRGYLSFRRTFKSTVWTPSKSFRILLFCERDMNVSTVAGIRFPLLIVEMSESYDRRNRRVRSHEWNVRSTITDVRWISFRTPGKQCLQECNKFSRDKLRTQSTQALHMWCSENRSIDWLLRCGSRTAMGMLG